MKKIIILLISLLFVGCSIIVDVDEFDVINISKSSIGTGSCLYSVTAWPFQIQIRDTCGKYNIGDKINISKKEIKR